MQRFLLVLHAARSELIGEDLKVMKHLPKQKLLYGSHKIGIQMQVADVQVYAQQYTTITDFFVYVRVNNNGIFCLLWHILPNRKINRLDTDFNSLF
jgi:hypothetical protein